MAPPGEIFVSETVRGLARTSSGVSFDDRGDHALKGVEGRQRLYAIDGALTGGEVASA
jgi:class 3 adenylate cyclase